jgi:hypothetical protein
LQPSFDSSLAVALEVLGQPLGHCQLQRRSRRRRIAGSYLTDPNDDALLPETVLEPNICRIASESPRRTYDGYDLTLFLMAAKPLKDFRLAEKQAEALIRAKFPDMADVLLQKSRERKFPCRNILLRSIVRLDLVTMLIRCSSRLKISHVSICIQLRTNLCFARGGRWATASDKFA